MAKRVAVVTGSNKGVGFGIVRALCQKFDGDVILTARDEGRGKEAVDALKQEGLSPLFHQLDITDHNSVVRLHDFLKEKYGGLDVLVNNAGIAYKASSTASFSEQAVVTLKTNFEATLDVCEVLFPLLRPHARVSNVSSFVSQMSLAKCSDALRSKFTNPNLGMDELVSLLKQFVESAKTEQHQAQGFPNSAYGMSKVGVTVMSIIQQRELDAKGAEDIVVNACCPGYVDTDMSSHKGSLTIDQGAVTPTYCALLPPNVDSPRGKFISKEKISEWKM
ncbi:carbonyl reductase [NADPH] 1 [Aplysia californica]|uniref:carbonyl reductase (NADPH) n=1 Tax=Aplysia californica TaxID=6500 RepID=A0ABM0JK41_APLCA|nr:carbonyl reductase [NADPH] 1 [Aplysia californica]XP_005095567.1 carbonyl reductase [NADPH] 1 [Aplysia californica]XP_035824909.1 carbonyl reductase [NADPH] 1 [Aplysia californica]